MGNTENIIIPPSLTVLIKELTLTKEPLRIIAIRFGFVFGSLSIRNNHGIPYPIWTS